MEETTGLTIAFSILFCAIASVSMFGCHQYEETKREFIRAGYEEKQGIGTTSTFWVKKPKQD